MERNKEYFQKRKQERESLEDSLPSDKQIELGDKEKPKEERSTPVYWQFDQNLWS